MITKGSKGYVPCLYMQIKYKSITVCIKNKTRGGDLKHSKEKVLHTLNMFPTIKQNKLKQTRKNDIKEESYLNYTTMI